MKNKIPHFILAIILFSTFMLIVNPGFEVKAQETPLWTGNAYSSTGDSVSTPALVEGTTYRIVATTLFWYNYSGNLEADAQYYTTATDNWQWTNYYPAPDGHSFLLINGADVNWGNFSNGETNHTYSINFLGQGLPITFQIYDWMDQNYTNNYCHIEISIFEGQPAPTPTATPSPSPSPSPTPTATPSPSPSPSPTPTPTPIPTPVTTPNNTPISTATPASTPTSISTPIPTATPSPTVLPTSSPNLTKVAATVAYPDAFTNFSYFLIVLAIADFVHALVMVTASSHYSKGNGVKDKTKI